MTTRLSFILAEFIISLPRPYPCGSEHQVAWRSGRSLEKCMTSGLKKMLRNDWIKAAWYPVRFAFRP